MTASGTKAPFTLALTQRAASAEGSGDNAIRKLCRCVNRAATTPRM